MCRELKRVSCFSARCKLQIPAFAPITEGHGRQDPRYTQNFVPGIFHYFFLPNLVLGTIFPRKKSNETPRFRSCCTCLRHLLWHILCHLLGTYSKKNAKNKERDHVEYRRPHEATRAAWDTARVGTAFGKKKLCETRASSWLTLALTAARALFPGDTDAYRSTLFLPRRSTISQSSIPSGCCIHGCKKLVTNATVLYSAAMYMDLKKQLRIVRLRTCVGLDST